MKQILSLVLSFGLVLGCATHVKEFKGIKIDFTFPKLPMETGDYYIKVHTKK